MLYAADYRKIANEVLKGRRGKFCGYIAVMMLFLTVITFLSQFKEAWFWSSILSVYFGGIFVTGSATFSIDCLRGKETEFRDGFNSACFFSPTIVEFFELLWSLLLIVPGIIKHYAYAMTFYILQDGNISTVAAMRKSARLMEGNKWRLFCLRISFIGWYLLGVCSLGIGFLWIIPYQKVAEAAFYESLIDRDFEPCYLNNEPVCTIYRDDVRNSGLIEPGINYHAHRTITAKDSVIGKAKTNGSLTDKVKTVSPQPQPRPQPKPPVTQTTVKTYSPTATVKNESDKKSPPPTTTNTNSNAENISSTVTKETLSTVVNDGANKDNRNEIANAGKEMRDDFNDWLILEGFFAVVREQLILNGIDDTFNRYEHSAIGTFTCNGNSVAIGYNVSESTISYSIKNRSVVKKDYSGDKDEIYEIVDEILKKAMTVETKSLSDTSINLGRVLTAADFENDMTEGTKAYEIYVRNCYRYGWDYSARGRFQKMQPLFSSNVTREGYDAWFVANNNTRTSAAKITGNWYNVIHKNGIEECWRAPYASGMGIRHDMLNDRITYVKTPNGYVFAGVYVPTGKIEKKIIEGEQFLVKSYVKIADNYPMNKNKT